MYELLGNKSHNDPNKTEHRLPATATKDLSVLRLITGIDRYFSAYTSRQITQNPFQPETGIADVPQ
jgi:hypothetical protein